MYHQKNEEDAEVASEEDENVSSSGSELALDEGDEMTDREEAEHRISQRFPVERLHTGQVGRHVHAEKPAQGLNDRAHLLRRSIVSHDGVEQLTRVIGRVGEAERLLHPEADLEEVDGLEAEIAEERCVEFALALVRTSRIRDDAPP